MTDERGTRAGLPERARHADDGRPAAPRKRRMAARRKQEAVLRIPRGEDLDLVSREIGVTAADLSAWRDSFLEAGAASLKSRPEDGRDRDLKAMREKIGEMSCQRMRHRSEHRWRRRTSGSRPRSTAWRPAPLFGCGGFEAGRAAIVRSGGSNEGEEGRRQAKR